MACMPLVKERRHLAELAVLCTLSSVPQVAANPTTIDAAHPTAAQRIRSDVSLSELLGTEKSGISLSAISWEVRCSDISLLSWVNVALPDELHQRS